ncbi:oxygen-independent coproporphyrinogen III oxidase [Roseateles amylovorans]|uniref:Coproporphyrinogen-III oxidase n=1 Tax=Roseateles amylovorans TaxID=2978473 RepID=A0ABY6B6C1_9BURK|nr:oxygen-independent coproporphyrinogen III oxidase [Roseateles amylovorans]UXH80055.1 oxygen-independent coproporphyrinogen III oxidase [Roseateles amylovorans]
MKQPSTSPAPDFIDDELLRRFDVAGPRYTSYPTADRFSELFGAESLRHSLVQRRSGPQAAQPVSLYVHIPFCESICYYCACNKVITRHHERAAAYLDLLDIELGLVAAALGSTPEASQLHLGGGSPTFLSDDELARLMQALRQRFQFRADAEISIEVDPRTVDANRLARLRELGFNRLSFGIQDFDPRVQRAVHREQSLESVAALMVSARALGFQSINADLIYGLPMQSPESFATTVQQVAALRPDRIALYGYAHLPHRFKPQRRIDETTLPPAESKLRMLSGAISGFLSEGYSYIGMDHFALPDDPLAVAKRAGRLHRNFQGYSTQPDRDLIALGVSAIARVGAHYAQNLKTLDAYEAALRAGRLPVERGLTLDRDDLIRQAAIMALMCQGRLDIPAFEQIHHVDFDQYFAAEQPRLRQLANDGLVALVPGAIQVTPLGWYFVRAVAMVFDRYLRRPVSASPEAGERAEPVRFSRIL